MVDSRPLPSPSRSRLPRPQSAIGFYRQPHPSCNRCQQVREATREVPSQPEKPLRVAVHDQLPLVRIEACGPEGADGQGGVDQGGIGAEQEPFRSEEHTSELQSRGHLVCRLLLEKKNKEQCYQRLTHYKTKHTK